MSDSNIKKVLVVPSGTEIGLDLHDALKRRRDIQLFGAESTSNSHAFLVFRDNSLVPRYDDPAFVGAINRIVSAKGIDYIFPAHDDVQLALLEAGTQIKCVVISSPLETVRVTRFKSKTYECLADSVPVPNTLDVHGDISKREIPFPVFVKPDRGQGSQQATVCADMNGLLSALHGASGMVVSEHLPGREATVDCFSDREKGLLFCSPRLRGRVRAGISVRSTLMDLPAARIYAEAISARLELHGAWFFQLKERSPNDWVLLEVGARLPGGTTFQRMRGINLPLLSIFEQQRLPIEILAYSCDISMDRAFISRFDCSLVYEKLFVDFDDTLVVKGNPNHELIALLVAARSRGKHLTLLSRNKGDCKEWLATLGLRDLFHKTILLPKDARKSAHMDSASILIDDSFQERKECHAAGFLCFDSDFSSVLLNQLSKD